MRGFFVVLIKRALALLMTLACGAAVYFSVIITDTPERRQADAGQPQRVEAAQPLPGGDIYALTDVAQAAPYFSGKVLTLAEGSGYALVKAELMDWRPTGISETVRELRLRYEGPDGTQVRVSSITPVGYAAHLPTLGYEPMLDSGVSLAGLQAVLLSSGDSVLVQARMEDLVIEMEAKLSPEALRKIAWLARLSGE